MAVCMIILVWVAWFLNMFISLFVLLNFINATFTAAIEAAMGRMAVQRTQVRARYNLDTWLVLSPLGFDKPFDSMILKYPTLPNQDGRWHGYWQAITRTLGLQTDGILEKIDEMNPANDQLEVIK